MSMEKLLVMPLVAMMLANAVVTPTECDAAALSNADAMCIASLMCAVDERHRPVPKYELVHRLTDKKGIRLYDLRGEDEVDLLARMMGRASNLKHLKCAIAERGEITSDRLRTFIAELQALLVTFDELG